MHFLYIYVHVCTLNSLSYFAPENLHALHIYVAHNIFIIIAHCVMKLILVPIIMLDYTQNVHVLHPLLLLLVELTNSTEVLSSSVGTVAN